MARSNCLLFAAALCWRRKRGGFTWRWSRHGPFPHFLYKYTSPGGRVRKVHFVPVAPSARLIPPARFVGRVKWGDG